MPSTVNADFADHDLELWCGREDWKQKLILLLLQHGDICLKDSVAVAAKARKSSAPN